MPEAQKGKEVCPRLHSGEESGREPRALSRGPGHMEINKGITLAGCGTGMTAGGHLDSNTAGGGAGFGGAHGPLRRLVMNGPRLRGEMVRLDGVMACESWWCQDI